MAKHFKKALSAFLALLMCVSTFAPAVMAEAATTTWLGDDVDLTFQAGEDPYVYAIAQDSVNNRYYYETSNHTVQITGGGAVHIFPIVDTTKVTGKWTPTGIYENGVSNYDVMYCCDATTGTDGEIYYKRVNLEDSEYFTTDEAKKLRAIVENAYPYVSVEAAKAALKEAGFTQADELDRSELITATQAAIWTIANPDSGDTYRYTRTATTAQKLKWGGYMHEFAAEITNFEDSTTARKYLTNPKGTGDRVDALIDFYLAMEGVDAEAGQIVISNLEIKNSKIAGSDDTYKVTLGVELNHGADDNDDVALNVYLNGELVENKPVVEGTEYTVNLVAKAKDKIKVEVTGMQNLERGVYFYAPKPQDIDGDGIATSREVSQNLIGVGSGETPVHAERNFTVDIVNVDLEINKVDGEGNPLSGAKFAIYDEEGQLVDTKTVGENGTLVFEGLIPGEYTLKETVAPFGYVLLKEAIEVVIDEDGSVFFNGKKLEDGDMTTTEPVPIEGEAVKSPEVTVDLVPGGDTENTEKSVEVENAAKTLVAVRKVTAEMTAVEVTVNTLSDGVASILPALKFDRNSSADQTQQKKDRELYTDNGHFHDPDTFTVTDAPAGYPFKYVGHGDYSGHYVSHVRVVYKRDAAGNALKDANGNYVIDHLEHVSSGTPLYYNGELSTNVQGPFHYATGTRPQQFLLKNENGDLIYGYCIDLETGANSGTWYAIANLEDNDYYASKEAENHVRNIIMNGYWGTESGTGSLASLKAALKAAIKNADAYGIDVEQDVTLVNRKGYTTGYELQEGEYHYGNYVYWSLPTEHIVLTDEIIDQLTEGEALDAMQAAIWSWANGSNATLNGVDRAIVGDLYAASSKLSDSLNGKNDPEGAARTKALYQYLMSLDEPIEASVVINDKTFAENMSLTVGNKIGDGIYKASLSFSLPVELGEQDNLTVKLTYVDAYGETQTIEKPLTGEGAIASENGIYTIDGLALRAGEAFDFSLNIYGGQYLEKSAYILTSQGGTGASQTMVTLAEGINTVDVTKSASITFTVEDHAEVTYNRYSYSVEIENEPKEFDNDKISTELYENKYADVTLSVSGDVEYISGEKLPVDIIYILGGFLSADQVKTNTMISVLTDTFRELIGEGIPVNFGIVPFSSTKDPVLPFVSLTTEADLETLPEKIAAAIQEAGDVYDAVNMENALLTATEMFSASELGQAGRTDRQHLVMISSGHTYFFNSGDNNEYISTVPVSFKKGTVDTDEIFYMEKAWMRARNNSTNSYPVPQFVTEYYKANTDKFASEWECYWSLIDQWAKADIAAGDTVVYEATTREAADFIAWFNSGKYSSNSSTFTYSGHGAVVSNPSAEDVANTLEFDMADGGTNRGPNPFVYDYAAHAIGNERAMWEAYTFIQDNITGKGINFYPVYNPLRANGTASNGSHYDYTWTTNYIGHCFMNMLAGGEAVWYSADKVFFDGIKAEIVGASGSDTGAASTPFVEDFIGFGEDYDFDFTGNLDKLVLEFNGNAYTTAQVEAMNGADASYTFSLNGKVGFTLDYFKGNGTTGERFVWSFLESLAEDDIVTLTYQLELVKRNVAVGTHKAETNQSATLYPTGDREYGIDFPVPEVEYVNVPEELEGDKKSEHLNGNRFEISIEVPGGDAKVMHDEVILMVDGSYSMDNEWPAMKEAITTIGKSVLDGSGHTQLTLMAFGMADNVVLEHVKTVEELAAALGELPGNLLYGRSSTNCEAGFTGVAEYIANHDETLGEVNVIFISDGNINTDETPRAFDANWKTWTKFGAVFVAQAAFEETLTYGENLPAAFTTVFGDRFDGATREEIISRAFGGEVTDEEFITFAEQVWTDVYAYSGLTRGVAYPVSDAERAFVKYDKENGTYIQDLFYYTTYNSAYVTYGDRWTRTPAAADALAAMDAVKALYVVDYDSYTSWMDTGIISDKHTFVQSNGIAGLVEALESTLKELALTPYKDVVITDYMSKWVNLDPSTLKIVDVSTGKTIWTAAEGWLIDENRPTAEEIPVIVELVDPAAYAAGGADVIGNTSGNIYKLTWYVKDGALLRSDNYKLVYEVEVDTEEEGFEYGVDYPANGTTTVYYNNLYGISTTFGIRVPNVTPEKPVTSTITFNKGDASNISFMLIDKETGAVEFLKKIDIGNQTSFEIPSEEGKISAVFVKQSTSGMFWFAEEVDEETQQAVINCLKKNNPSYKGHNAIAFGAGDHDLEFKKNKFVTYTFTGKVVETEVEDSESEEIVEAPETEAPEVEAPVVDEPVVDEPVVDEPVVNTPVVEEPAVKTLNYEVKGAKITSWTVVDGITAIYIKGSGKVPSVLWTSEKAEDMTLINILVELDLLNNFPEYQFDTVGAHTFHYQQNKKKTVSVTYTFIEK